MRKYIKEDLVNVTKAGLVAMIRAQPEYVPKPFNPSRMPINDLRQLLLDVNSPFRKMEAPDTSSTSNEKELERPHVMHVTTSDSPLSPPPLSPPPQAPPNAEANSGVQVDGELSGHFDLRVYIEDRRFTGFLQSKTVKNVTIQGIEHTEDGDEQYISFRTKQLLKVLQQGIPAVSGSEAEAVKIGFKDADSPDFVEFFVESEPSKLHVADPYPEEFRLSADGEPKITILVDFSTREPTRSQASIDQQSGSSASQVLDISYPVNPRQELIDWLKIKASEQPGYSLFASSRHRALQNTEAKNKKIMKSDIYTALGIKETSLGDAEQATRILRIFGEGGTHPAQPVIDESLRETEPPQGSVKFLKFLKRYDKEHSSAL